MVTTCQSVIDIINHEKNERNGIIGCRKPFRRFRSFRGFFFPYHVNVKIFPFLTLQMLILTFHHILEFGHAGAGGGGYGSSGSNTVVLIFCFSASEQVQ